MKVLNTTKDSILVVNAGSSSIKISLFQCAPKITLIKHFEIHALSEIKEFLMRLENFSDKVRIKAVGHRVVHGGKYFSKPVLVNATILKKLEKLIPLAPLHQPHNINAIKLIKDLYPNVPQIACFDTAFHATQSELSKTYAIPKKLTANGLIRYGFHGISYEYIASVLKDKIDKKYHNKVIVAHLGSGASMCAMHNKKSVATTMGFSVLDGLVMGSRCGQIDPGILIYLLQEENYSAEKIQHILYHESGLLGVSSLTSDMKKLLKSNNHDAKKAVDLFCYRAALEFTALITTLGGCEGFIFTGGIGEKSSEIRQRICNYLKWLKVDISPSANKNNKSIISTSKSKILVSVIPTNEELMIAQHTLQLC